MKNKNTRLLIFSVFTLFIFSCSSDDSKGNDQGIEDEEIIEEDEDEEEDTEETGIDASVVFENVIVDGGSKESGSLSTPNEGITFELVSGNIALPTEGFDIELNSDSDLAGAYLRFKNDDGTIADGYYDIDFSALSEDKPFNKSIKRRNSKIKTRLKAVESDFSIDIDFTSTLEPGTFCYLISVYDADGNVSEEQEACITIKDWGGNDDLIGTWNLTKEEEFYDDELLILDLGEEDCYIGGIFSCNDSGEIVEHTKCYTRTEYTLIFRADGSYVEEYNFNINEVNFLASEEACEPIYRDVQEHNIDKGYWSYNADKNELILAGLEYSNTYDGQLYEELFEEGDADINILYMTLNNNQLITNEEYLNSNGSVEEYFKNYYIKQ